MEPNNYKLNCSSWVCYNCDRYNRDQLYYSFNLLYITCTTYIKITQRPTTLVKLWKENYEEIDLHTNLHVLLFRHFEMAFETILFTLISFEVIRVNNYLQTILHERECVCMCMSVCVYVCACVCVYVLVREREWDWEGESLTKFRVTYPIIIINKGEINFVWRRLSKGKQTFWIIFFYILGPVKMLLMMLLW